MRVRRTIVLLTAALASGCLASAPPKRPAPLLRLDVGVYDVGPGPQDAVDGALVEVLDGQNKGIRGTTGAQGNVILTGLHPADFTVCASHAGYQRACVPVLLRGDSNTQIHLTPDAPPPPVVPPAAVVHADGRIFRDAAGQPWQYMGVSSFRLADRFAKGEDIGPVYRAFAGYNALRVWPYVKSAAPPHGWGAGAWSMTDVGTWRRFIADAAAHGFQVELTLLTDDDPARLAWAKAFVPQLTAGGCPPTLWLEAGNEPRTHKAIDTAALKAVLQASGCKYASGDYEDSNRFYGSYGTWHPARTKDWPRRTHDALEFYAGGGPNAKTDPAHRNPWIADEPGKPQDVGSNPAEWRAFYAGCSTMAAGCTFHFESGKQGQPPTPQEAALAKVALDAMTTIPDSAPLGPYRRIVESGQTKDARTYVIGGWMIRCQQAGTQAPEPGWTPMDSFGVLFRR